MSCESGSWSSPPTYEVEIKEYNRELVEQLFRDLAKRRQTMRLVRESVKRELEQS